MFNEKKMIWAWLLILIGLVWWFERRDGFKLQVEADAPNLFILPNTLKKWGVDYYKQGRSLVWDLIPFKHVYRRWRRKM